MKIYTEKIKGCIWCPHHIRRGYSNDKKTQGRCKAVIVKGNNYKLIRGTEMREEEHPQNPYRVFPEWCPLDSE